MKTYFLFYLASVILLGSCARAYVPNVINTPLLSEKGEVQASFYTSHSGFDPQVSFAVTDHIGLLANGSFSDKESDVINKMHHHRFLEVGAGYYTPFENSGRFEIFGGYGFGILQAETDLELWSSTTNASTVRYFIQPALGVSTDFADLSIASRFVYLELNQHMLHYDNFFAEPAITGKLGYKYVKLIFQVGRTFPIGRMEPEFKYQHFLFSAGIQFNIGRFHE